MKKLYLGLLGSLFSLLVFVAGTTVQPLCIGFVYQPKVPRALR